jgi:hypothetical protein
MKAGDKVYVEVEVKALGPITFRDKRGLYWNNELAITKLPIQEGRWMMTGAFEDRLSKKFVIGKVEGLFVTFDFCNGFDRWKYAKEIPTKRKLTMQEIAEKFNEDVENIEIEGCQ